MPKLEGFITFCYQAFRTTEFHRFQVIVKSGSGPAGHGLVAVHVIHHTGLRNKVRIRHSLLRFVIRSHIRKIILCFARESCTSVGSGAPARYRRLAPVLHSSCSSVWNFASAL
jgi:hypothetical protein